MVKRKAGNKSWRKINTQDVTDFLEKETREERQGLAVEGVPDADLFFIDKGGDEEAVVAVKQGRKQAARSKVLRSQAILQAAHNAKPAGKMVGRKPKGSVLAQQQKEQQAGQQQRLQVQQQRDGGKAPGGGRKGKKAGAAVAASFDLWEDPEDTRDGWTDSMLPAKRPRRGPAPASQLRQPGEASTALVRVKGAKEARSEAQRPAVAAVEIDPAGCSYNPDRGQHQEAVAAAVAVETKKMLDRELQPVAPPRVVDYQPETDELALLQTLGGEADEEEEEEEGGEDADMLDGDGGGVEAARRRREAEKKTRKDRNKDKRRKDAEDQQQLQRKLKAQRHELSSLKQIEQQLAEEEIDQEAARLRRQLDKEERLAAEPPKLSKHRFQPMPLQVLTSDELAGSLRRLKPTAMLAKDRFKSLQKRALIEPRRKIEQKKQAKKIEYVQGERAERALERQKEIQELRAKKQRAKKEKKAAQQ